MKTVRATQVLTGQMQRTDQNVFSKVRTEKSNVADNLNERSIHQGVTTPGGVSLSGSHPRVDVSDWGSPEQQARLCVTHPTTLMSATFIFNPPLSVNS